MTYCWNTVQRSLLSVLLTLSWVAMSSGAQAQGGSAAARKPAAPTKAAEAAPPTAAPKAATPKDEAPAPPAAPKVAAPPPTATPAATAPKTEAPPPLAAPSSAAPKADVEAASPATAPKDSAPAASALPVAPVATSAAHEAAGPALCLIGAADGLPISDAMTSAALICEALHDKGAYVDSHPVLGAPVDAAAGTAAFRISLRPLGQAVLLQVSFESPLGKVLDTRSMQLGHIEEVPVAAPRIADSLMTGKSLSETAKVDTLVGSETRTYAKQYGELKLGIGVFGFGVPGTDVFGGYGVHGQLYYETAAYAVGAELRIGGSASGSGDSNMESVSLGARYFLNQGDITPFVGGGVGVLWLAYHDKVSSASILSGDYYGSYTGSGLALHGEAGIEFLRLHDARMDVLLRIDAPLYQMTNDSTGSHHGWAPPISLMAAYSFN